MSQSTQEQLDRVQALIAQIEAHGTASYGDGSQTYTYQDLDTLYRREEQLLKRLAGETSGNFRLGAFRRK